LLSNCYIALNCQTYTKYSTLKIQKPLTSELWKQICLNDDLKAFEQMFHLLNTKLIKFCMFYTRQKEVAEDIVSDIFIKCWESRKNLTDVINPETYLFVAVKNQSFNYLKKFSNIHLVQVEETNEIGFINTYDPQKEMERKELHFLLDKAISSLPQQACIIFRLIKEDGMRYKEVAEILNISPRTVQTQLFRAIKKLSLILASHQASAKSLNKMVIKQTVVGFCLCLMVGKYFF
jgi:RNA polymerase sigma-70 factor (family 1)